MTQQNARELVIKRGANADGSGAVTFVCGIRTKSFQMANAQVDTTVPSCITPSNPIIATAKPGRQAITFAGDGLFDSDAMGVLVADDARLQRTPNYTIIVPGYGTFVGPFMVADFEWSGEMDEQLAFSATWIPTDNALLTFTAAV